MIGPAFLFVLGPAGLVLGFFLATLLLPAAQPIPRALDKRQRLTITLAPVAPMVIGVRPREEPQDGNTIGNRGPAEWRR